MKTFVADCIYIYIRDEKRIYIEIMIVMCLFFFDDSY